ncbi:MAG: PhzF family phenazine biosynthesis protein [Pseudomonadota bacterium]
MALPFYQINSFTTEVFAGNPAGVVMLSDWPTDKLLQAMAAEHNLAATAFFTTDFRPDCFRLRWFTPIAELPLCAHGTLGAAWVISEAMNHPSDRFLFLTKAGDLPIERIGRGRFKMSFPLDPYVETEIDPEVAAALGKEPEAMLRARYSVAVYESEREVQSIKPNIAAINQCRHAKRPGAVVVTALAGPGQDYDFVSRFFAPGVGVDEDPVTGSAHCILAKYWADRLGRSAVRGFQASNRGGFIDCEVASDRVVFTGDAVPYSKGEILAAI